MYVSVGVYIVEVATYYYVLRCPISFLQSVNWVHWEAAYSI